MPAIQAIKVNTPVAANDQPTAEIGRFEVEAVAGIPDEMPDAVAQMVEQGDATNRTAAEARSRNRENP